MFLRNADKTYSKNEIIPPNKVLLNFNKLTFTNS